MKKNNKIKAKLKLIKGVARYPVRPNQVFKNKLKDGPRKHLTSDE
jgi:hypothetical protein